MRLAILLLGWALALPLQAATASDWLARVAPALRTLDYRGTVVVVADGRVETLRVLHRNDGDRERERLVALSGPPREVVRDGDRVLCIGLGEGAAGFAVAGGWSPAPRLGGAAGLASYRTRLGGRGRVAGHRAQVVEVEAGDAWRFGYRLWLEQGSGLPLRVDLLGPDGRAIEQVAFTELELGVAPGDEELAPGHPAATRVAAEAAPPSPRGEPRWRVASPPPGFELRSASAIPGGMHLVYDDGLATVSVYVERAGPGLRGSASRRSGALHARTYWTGGWRVMALGKVPAATVDHFARNLRADGDG